jgi:hypothetical protein
VKAVFFRLQKELVMEGVTEDKTYLSPEYKLREFFEKSRDRWKSKALKRKQHIRRLEKRVAALETSRRKWKEKAQTQRPRVVVNDDCKEKRTRV